MTSSASKRKSTKTSGKTPSRSAAAPTSPLTEIEVESRRGGVETLPVASVEWFEAERDYVRLHTDTGEFLIRRSMRALEAELDPRRFIRTHRSSIVNRGRIRKVERLEGGRMLIRLACGKTAPVSAAHAADVRGLPTES